MKPLTDREIADGRMRSFSITIAVEPNGKPFTVHIAAITSSRALRIMADRMELPDWESSLYASTDVEVIG
jgi:hypothetical protein